MLLTQSKNEEVQSNFPPSKSPDNYQKVKLNKNRNSVLLTAGSKFCGKWNKSGLAGRKAKFSPHCLLADMGTDHPPLYLGLLVCPTRVASPPAFWLYKIVHRCKSILYTHSQGFLPGVHGAHGPWPQDSSEHPDIIKKTECVHAHVLFSGKEGP